MAKTPRKISDGTGLSDRIVVKYFVTGLLTETKVFKTYISLRVNKGDNVRDKIQNRLLDLYKQKIDKFAFSASLNN